MNYAQLLFPDFSLILCGYLVCRYTALNRTVWQQVESLVDRRLASGGGTLVRVARQIGLHERTLQRRLKEHAVFRNLYSGFSTA